jgi:tetratricopeptide (TPR) repeat protein
LISIPLPGLAQGALSDLLAQLRAAQSESDAQRLENQIVGQWSKSGSQAMDLLLGRGRDALARKDPNAALEHFRALTDHAPDFAEGWFGLGLGFSQQDQLGPALDAFGRTLALNPDHFQALHGVATIHEKIGNLELAYQAYEQVLEMRPHDSVVTGALARLETKVRGRSL